MTIKQYKPKKSSARKFQSKSNRRDTRQERGYDGAWYAFRARFLKRNPKCYVCGMKSDTVDHIKRARGNMEYFKHPENFLPMCASCHGVVTQKFDRAEIQDLEGKLKYIKKMREFNKCSVKVGIVKYEK